MARTKKTWPLAGAGRLFRFTDESAANTALTVTTPKQESPQRLLLVTVKFSGAPAAGTITVKLKSGAGASWDTELHSVATAQNVKFIPDEAVIIGADDQLEVAVPAGGVGVTAAVAIYLSATPQA